ncbi:MAG: miniconductance mechanosensitive channel, partial [Arcticibacterium sp.]
MLEIIRNWIINRDFDLATADIFARALIFTSIIIISLIAYVFAKHFIVKGLAAIINKTATQWDDMILRKRVFNRLAYFAPAIVLYISISTPLEGYEWLITLIDGVVLIYMIVIGILVIDAFLNASRDIYKLYDVSNRIPIKGFIQVIKIFIYFTSGIFIISILLNKTPIYLFSSLG